jgi:hypothetical protein
MVPFPKASPAILSFFLLTSIIIPVSGVDDAQTGVFYQKRLDQLRTEYRNCTGDTTRMDSVSVTHWKTGLDEWLVTPQKDSVSKLYERTTGIKDGIGPCELYVWFMNRKDAAQNEFEADSMALSQRKKLIEDSLYLKEQLQTHPRSKADFYNIPFGITKRSFMLLFFDRFTDMVMDDYDRLVIKGFMIDNTPYDAAFYFGSYDSLQWYQIETPSFSSDSLDLSVRPLAEKLSVWVEKTLGHPDHIYRIGFFDIVQDRPCPYKTWSTDNYDVYVGLATYKYRYYAKTVVIAKPKQ